MAKASPAAKKKDTISAYIAGFPEETQVLLKQLYACLKKAAPKSEEAMKWGAPAFSYERILFVFGGAKKHVALYSTPTSIKAFAKELSGYTTGKGSVQFPLGEKLPVGLITKIAKYRVKELKEKDVRWM